MKAILAVPAKGRESDANILSCVLKIFGASSLEECAAIYDSVGKAERASLDEAVARVTKDANAAFLLGVDLKSS
ncbi:MAG TPA: hypothetical protein VF266_25285 [Thermoanaerobaculia bacterium]